MMLRSTTARRGAVAIEGLPLLVISKAATEGVEIRACVHAIPARLSHTAAGHRRKEFFARPSVRATNPTHCAPACTDFWPEARKL